MRIRLSKKFIALTVVILHCGCAVLRVDVDVYKGPLANHERVQLEQMATMAIGAKPLLIELRDRMEWVTEVQVKRERQAAIEEGWYKPGFVQDPRLRDVDYTKNSNSR